MGYLLSLVLEGCVYTLLVALLVLGIRQFIGKRMSFSRTVERVFVAIPLVFFLSFWFLSSSHEFNKGGAGYRRVPLSYPYELSNSSFTHIQNVNSANASDWIGFKRCCICEYQIIGTFTEGDGVKWFRLDMKSGQLDTAKTAEALLPDLDCSPELIPGKDLLTFDEHFQKHWGLISNLIY